MRTDDATEPARDEAELNPDDQVPLDETPSLDDAPVPPLTEVDDAPGG